MRLISAPGFVPGFILGAGALWGFHKFVKPVKGKGA